MKKLMTALALTALAATPALADTYHTRSTTGTPMWSADQQGSGAYAYAPGTALNSRGPVFANGQYQGSDPDPFIRQQLRRDPPNNPNVGGF
jgi:hypothetical protein